MLLKSKTPSINCYAIIPWGRKKEWKIDQYLLTLSRRKKNLLHVLSHTEIIILAGQHIFLMDRQAKTVERIH